MRLLVGRDQRADPVLSDALADRCGDRKMMRAILFLGQHAPSPYSTTAADWAAGMSFIPRLEQSWLMVELPDHWMVSATTCFQPFMPEKFPR